MRLLNFKYNARFYVVDGHEGDNVVETCHEILRGLPRRVESQLYAMGTSA